jgi:hypothetical protein
VTESGFDDWLRSLIRSSDEPADEAIDDEWLAWLRELYALRGPLSRAEVHELALWAQIASAEEAFPLVVADIERTTDQSASFQIFRPDWQDADSLGLTIRLNDGGTSLSPIGWGPTLDSALVAVADFAMEWVMEALWTAWPVCPADNYGLDATLVDGKAVWRCRSALHEVVAPIGELGL